MIQKKWQLGEKNLKEENKEIKNGRRKVLFFSFDLANYYSYTVFQCFFTFGDFYILHLKLRC